MKVNHDRIEAIAGAIALGEAGDEERREYREHLAGCASCLRTLGGEHEIERVAAGITSARESEVWQPALGDVVRTRLAARSRYARYLLSTLAACLIVAVGMRIAVANGALRALVPAARPAASSTGATRIVLEERSLPVQIKPIAESAPRRLMVVHNVVQMARAPLAAAPAIAAPKPHSVTGQIAAITVHPDIAQPQLQKIPKSDVPIWRRNDPSWRTVARTTTTSVSESAPQSFTQSAESIRMMRPPVVREALPVGGETAINPQPPMIAYDEGAEGTTVFEVIVDEQGSPTKCIITRSSGYEVLDDSVCAAAMRARYTPKTVDGRPAAGIYHDAFTFRMSEDDQSTTPVHK